jgi:hypothetical protein
MNYTASKKVWAVLALSGLLLSSAYCSGSSSEASSEMEEEEKSTNVRDTFGEYYGQIWNARNRYWRLMGWGNPISDEGASDVHFLASQGEHIREGCNAEQSVPQTRAFSVEAGPIWNNRHAQRRCPTVCSTTNSRWTGHWWTTVWNRMSVCQCRTRNDRIAFRVYSNAISDYPVLSEGEKEIMLTPDQVSNAASVVFFDSKLKAPYQISFEYKVYDEDAGPVWNTADGISVMLGKNASAYNQQDVPAGGKRAFLTDGSGYGVHLELYGSRKVSFRNGDGSVLKSRNNSSIFRNGEWQTLEITVEPDSVDVHLNGERIIVENASIGEGYLGIGAATGAADGAHYIRNIRIKDKIDREGPDCAVPSNLEELVDGEDKRSSLTERLGDAYESVINSIREILETMGEGEPILASPPGDGESLDTSNRPPEPAFPFELKAPSGDAALTCGEDQRQVGFRKPTGQMYSVEAGPIWNIGDGTNKCPEVCSNDDPESKWTGHWWTTVWNKMSVCQCQRSAVNLREYTVEAGPIWNNRHAQRRCPAICPTLQAEWTGHWWTTVWGRMSVCQCKEVEKEASFQGFRSGFSASYPAPVLSGESGGRMLGLLPKKASSSTERASVAFFNAKLKLPYTLEFEYKIARTPGTGGGPSSAGGLAVFLSKDASAYLEQSVPTGAQRGFINDGSGYGIHFDVYSQATDFDTEDPKGIYLKDGNGQVLSSVSDTSVANLNEWQKVTVRVTEDSVQVLKGDQQISVDDLSITEGYIGIAASSESDGFSVRNVSVNACR